MKISGLEKMIFDSLMSLEDVLKVLDSTNEKVILVVNDTKQLVGTLTDGDIRRGLLKFLKKSDSISEFMNTNPFFIYQGTKLELSQVPPDVFVIPVLAKDKKILDIQVLENQQDLSIKVALIMAGGFGKRLGAISKKIPKPMNEINGKPLLEWLILDLVESGIEKIYISVFYKKEIIKSHFGDGKALNCSIEYLEENEPLGTAGCLSLIKDRSQPIMMLNSDLVTTLDFQNLFKYHKKNNNSLTVSIREHTVHIPFGVFNLQSEKIKGLEEKPSKHFFINAGIYILEPEILDLVQPNTFVDITDIIENLIVRNIEIGAFFIHEEWIDIGFPKQLQKARSEFKR